MNWRELAAAVNWDIRPFINGRYVKSSAPGLFDNINPADESVLCRASVGDARDVDAAVSVARQRFDEGCWSELPAWRRAEVLSKLAELLLAHKFEIALFDTLEMGRPIQAAVQDAERASALLRS